MKDIQFYILFLWLLCVQPAISQKDSITALDEVFISDFRLVKNSEAQQVLVLNDSTMQANEPLLGSLLKFNSPIYFKENGYGMVSSASFRGTTASQTAVIWNGININSQFNGQTDFNTINTTGYDNIAVRAGGGSVLYGSGAIGGSVHLNNGFGFNEGLSNRVGLEYGSFDTYRGSYSGEYSSEKTSVYWNAGGIKSDNDYPYLGTEKKNENGDFQNYSVNAGIAHWLDKKNILKFHSSITEGERGFSGTLSAPSRSKYEDVNSRNLLEWTSFLNKFTSHLKFAYLKEEFKYFENRESEDFSYGDARSFIGDYDLSYRLKKDMKLNAIVDYRHTNGEGTNVGENSRNITAFSLLFEHQLDKFFYEFSARKEYSDHYESPFLFSFNSTYEVAENYLLKLNFSRNFRIPTYNDLFWYAGGNLELSPESSWQGELGQSLYLGNFELNATAYWIRIENLLRWTPGEDGLWRPENTEKVRNLGVEASLAWEKMWGDHHLKLNSTYAFTKTRDLILEKELIYTPKNKATASFGYGYKRLGVFWQFLYNGKIFTSSDNNYSLPAYNLSNVGLNFAFGKKENLKLGVTVRNLFEEKYQSLPSRPMPGRSYHTSLTFKL